MKTDFKPKSWLAKINFINHHVLFNNVLMAVVAESGGGKTTFIKLLQEGLDPSIRQCVVNASAVLSQEALLAQLLKDMEVQSSGEGTQNDLASLVSQINQQQIPFLLIIDDANLLPEAMLKKLLDAIKHQDKKHFFHVCLCSDFSLVSVLNQLQRHGFKELIQIIEPGTLSESEAKLYVLDRLQAFSLSEKNVTASKMDQFYHRTDGHIARINQQVAQFFNAPETTPFSWRRALVMMFVVFALGLGSVFWFHQHQTKVENEAIATRTKLLQEFDARTAQDAKNHPAEIAPLTSQILPYTVSSVHWLLQPAPLKNIFKDDDDNQESFLESLVIMDKVIVIPKVIHVDQDSNH